MKTRALFKTRVMRRGAFALFGLVVCVCVAEPLGDAPQADSEWSARKLGDEIAGEDSWQGFNRTMFGIESVVMNYIVTPLSHVYCSLIPKPLILGIDNALDNSEYPVRFFATLLRGEGRCAWDETKRFAVNTVLGVGGLFDPAENCFGIFSTEASLSGTLAAYGIPQGQSLVLPFVPRAHVRGCAGYVLDQGLDPKTYIDIFFPTGIGIGWTAAFWPNDLAMGIGPWNTNVRQAAAPYDAYRRLLAAKSLLDERLAVYHYMNELAANEEGTRRPPVRRPPPCPEGIQGRWREIAGYEPRAPAIDTLRLRLFAPTRDEDFWWIRPSVFNGDFAGEVMTRTLPIVSDQPDARYGFVPATTPSSQNPRPRLVFVIPGIGTEFDAVSTLAMAELLHDAGTAVVTIDNPFNWRYVLSVNQGILPGNFAEDARRLASFMRTVIEDLSRNSLVDTPEVSVVGWSMGGLFTAYLAELECRDELGFAVDKLLAINPPVDFDHVISTLESFMEPSRSWSREQALEKFVDVAPRLLVWDELQFDDTPDISEEDARYTVAASLVAGLPELVSRVTQKPSSISAREYFMRYARDATSENGLSSPPRHVGMRTCESALRRNAHFSVIHTRDDFLLSAADRDYLDSALGKRVTWFSSGAHCGMFHTPEFKQEVLMRIDLARE